MVHQRYLLLLSARLVGLQGIISDVPAINHQLRLQFQPFWTAAAHEQAHSLEPRSNVIPAQWISTTGRFVPAGSGAAKLGIPDNMSAVEQQELLWRQYFLDPTVWWDYRTDKTNARSPDFRHKESKEPLWLNNFHKPEWVDAQLAVLDNQFGSISQPTSHLLLHQNGGAPLLREERQVCSTPQDVTKHLIEYCESGQLSQAIDTLTSLAETQPRVISTSVLYRVIQRCGAEKNLVLGRHVDDLVVKLGYESNAFLGNHVLRMYACQGRLQEAMGIFKRVARPSVFMWFSIISAQAKHGKPSEAIQLYHEMRGSGLEPNQHIFVAALQACAKAEDVESGRQVHSDVLESGLELQCFVCNCLVEMYAKCGELADARRVFDGMATRDVVAWNSMIHGYAEHGLNQEALTLYAKMEQDGDILPDSVTYACVLKACTSAGAVHQGKELHAQILERGLLEGNVALGNCLVHMYAKCGKLEDARKVFDNLPTRDAVTWNTMINGYAEHELSSEALTLYAKMEQDGVILGGSATFACLLKACASAGAVQLGKKLHLQAAERGLLEHKVVSTCLVNMYARCGKVEDARRVFDSLATRDVVTWTAMINGYGTSDQGHKAIACFEEMIQAGVRPDDTTFTCLLVACSHEGLVSKGRQYFDAMLEQHGVIPTAEHYTCMVDLLGRAGHLDDAEKMLSSGGCNNDVVGLMSLLHACKSHRDIERGARCFECLLALDPKHASPYVLMANIYADADRWGDVDRVERLRKSAGASKKPAVAGIEVNKQVHTFVVGEDRDGISCKVRSTNLRLQVEGNHVPLTKLVLKPMTEKEKEDDLCGHAEKLALAYGLLNTPDGTPLLVTKNLRMCGDCHSSTEVMSRVERRNIVVRDGYRVHRFEAGSCSCRGRC